MPRSAIASGVVDLILAPEEIAKELVRIGQHPLLLHSAPKSNAPERVLAKNNADTFSKILILLRNQCHVDFSHYKHSTLKRRIARRIVLQKKESLKDYFEYLQTNSEEVKLLFADILINVTEFFRDPGMFAEFKAQIVPTIMKNKAPNSPVRIWVVGCATGEEAYSVAMSLLEHMGEFVPKNSIQIFATDISESVIQKARAGAYPDSISKNVSEERLRRFFVKTDTGYKIKPFLREMCLFSWHDVIRDPPFAKLDLICCRNLLIYFDPLLQKHVLPIFHYALNPGGFLWLGSSESIGELSSLFHLVDKTNKFYSRKSVSAMPKFQFPTNTYIPEKIGIKGKPAERIQSSRDIQREADRIASLKYAPPSIVINNDMEIVFIRGETTPYLQLMPGQASFNLFKLARTEIASDLRMTIQAVKQKNTSMRKDGLMLRVGEQLQTFNLDITPLAMFPPINEHYFLISFEPIVKAPVLDKLPTIVMQQQRQQPIDAKDQRNSELEQELTETKRYQHSLIQDFEATQEELTSANEELQSTNEELQSTNEELETAKEELQSANEELTTVNDELQNRNRELAQLNNDLVNLLGCVDIPIVMVGIDGCIRRFTPKASKVMNLISSDVGRPISDFKPTMDMPDLAHCVSEVIETITARELDVQDREGHWFRLQVRPYKTADNRIEGAVIVLMDIQSLKQNLLESKSALDYATSIANTVPLPLVVLDSQLQLKSANQVFYEQFHATAKNEGTDLFTIIGGTKKAVSSLRKTLTDVFVSKKALKDFEINYEFSNAECRNMLLNVRQVEWIGDEPHALLLAMQDMTDRHRLEITLKKAVQAAEKANQAKDTFLATLSHELRNPLTSILSWAQLLLKTEKGSIKLKRGLNIIEQSALTQGQMINDLLEISRIQAGKLILNISKLDPREVIQTAVDSVRPLAENKPVTIETHLIRLPGKVAADPARLQQIIWNLLSNAIKFSPANGMIDVYLGFVEERQQRYASIKIVDQGKGITPEFLPRLFERFTQADSATTRNYGGLGIGLAIVHDLLKLLGGTVRAENNPEGKGATFTVLLPLVPNGTQQKMKTQTKVSSRKIAKEAVVLQPKLDGLSVLIVEDEQNSLDAVTELLNSVGARAIPAASVAEALIAFDEHKPDILISDIAMPGEDGYTLIRKLRARGSRQGGQIPAVALTAYATQKEVNQVLAAGFNAHLAKPFKAVDLFRLVAAVAKRKL